MLLVRGVGVILTCDAFAEISALKTHLKTLAVVLPASTLLAVTPRPMSLTLILLEVLWLECVGVLALNVEPSPFPQNLKFILIFARCACAMGSTVKAVGKALTVHFQALSFLA